MSKQRIPPFLSNPPIRSTPPFLEKIFSSTPIAKLEEVNPSLYKDGGGEEGAGSNYVFFATKRKKYRKEPGGGGEVGGSNYVFFATNRKKYQKEPQISL